MKRSLNSPKNFSRDGGMVEITFSMVASLIILEYLNSCIIRIRILYGIYKELEPFYQKSFAKAL